MRLRVVVVSSILLESSRRCPIRLCTILKARGLVVRTLLLRLLTRVLRAVSGASTLRVRLARSSVWVRLASVRLLVTLRKVMDKLVNLSSKLPLGMATRSLFVVIRIVVLVRLLTG